MYTNPMHPHMPHHPTVLYQADPAWVPMLKEKKEKLHATLRPYIGRTIRVQTLDGHTYEGVLVNMDGHHVYLQVTNHGPSHGHHPYGQHRAFYNPASATILTLVLYELLVITLLA